EFVYTYTIEREPFTTIAPAGSTVACVASAVTSTIQLPTVTDNCGNSLSPTPASPATGGTYDGCEGTKTFTYTYTDCEGNSREFVYTYTIEREPFTTIAPAGSTVACVASAVTSTIQLPTVTDNCGNSLSPTPASPATGGTYDGCEGTKTFTYTYTDCEGNSREFVYTYTIEREPFTTIAPAGSTVACVASAVTSTIQLPTVTDNCGNSLSPTPASPATGGTYDGCEGTKTFTYTYADCEGNSQEFVYTYTIEREPFTTIAPAGSTVACVASAVTSTVQLPTVTDNCGNSLSPTPASPATSGTYDGCEGTKTFTYTYTDCEGNSQEFVYTYTIDDTIAPTATVPTDITGLQCIADIPAADINAIIDETDNCSGTINVIVSDSNNEASGCKGNPYIVTRTYTLTDCSGNETKLVQTITVEDTTAPILAGVPANVTAECNAIPAVEAAVNISATDNCDVTPIVTYLGEVRTDGDCANNYTLTRTWRAEDACGNVSTASQTITVQDTTPPTITPPQNIILSSGVNCVTDISPTITGNPIYNDICDSNLAPPTYSDSECFGNSNNQEINAGNGNYFPFTISGFDNLTAANIEKISLAFETNQGKGRAEFILVAPSGQAIKLVGPYCEGGECDDESSNTQELYLPVFYPNSSGYTKWNNNDFIQDGISQNLIPNGETPSSNSILGVSSFVSSFEEFTGSMNGDWFVYSKKQATVNGSVKFKSVCLKPTSLCVGNKVISRTWTVTDACGNIGTANQTIIIEDTTAPTWITATDALNTSIECNNPEALATAQAAFPAAADLCDTDVSNITKVSGAFVASSECDNAGTYTNTWTVNDDCGNTSAVFTQVITIQDTTAPTWSTLATALDTTIECSDAEALATAQAAFPAASDLCDTDVSNITKVSGAFVASSECDNAGTYTNTWTVNDDCGNTSAVFTQVITIQDTTAPTWSTLATALDTTIECSDTEALATAQAAFPAAADLCDTDVTDITKVVGAFVASSECDNAGTYTNTWTVNDDCGNTSAVFTQVITIQDTTAPTWSTQETALDTTIECSDVEALATAQAAFPVAADLCDTDVTDITKVVGAFVASSECDNAGTYTNTWTINDDCGNTSAVFTQVITIQDTTAPTWSTQETALNTTIECSDTEALATAQAAFPAAADLCDTDVSNITKVVGAFVASSECDNAGTYTNTWTVNDDCGNTSAVFTQVITIQDTTAPTWSTLATALDTTIECSDTEALATAQAAFPVAADLCDTDVTDITKVVGAFVASSECDNAGTYTNTWTINDDCGNTSAVFTQVITIQDTTAPTWSTQETALNTTIECSDTEALATAQAAFPAAADLCDTDVSNITKVVGAFVASSECANAGTYTNTWTANDDCGNTSAVFTQVITIQDTTAPVIAELPVASTISCGLTPNFAQALATDTCGSVNLTFVDVTVQGSCIGSYTITRTWTAADACGNASTATQTINIVDTVGPTTATQFSSTVNVNCDAIPAKPELVFVDNCSTVSPAIFTENIINRTENSYSMVRKWSVADACGNVSEFTQIINVTIPNSVVTISRSICNDGEITTTNLNDLLPVGTPTNGTWVDVNNSGGLQGSILNASGLSVRDYTFEYKINDTTCPRTIRIVMTVNTGCGGIVLACGTVLVHNAFSPNGDGINEKFIIDNIDDTVCYPENTVEIYNRWGVLVFETKGYNNTSNSFDGISGGRSTVQQSSGLPTGTYFYILNYTSVDNDGKIITNKKDGYLYLTK
ncbi:gliding motility-associated C-terminal domain-containing protein, partial [Flavobacterium yafengii]|uniref:gliding motility-associated C-terminal domain-containing protein n=1 Tax=Flavobacterium yafengii TaxID=3041253 RepID=UPI0024A8A8DF